MRSTIWRRRSVGIRSSDFSAALRKTIFTAKNVSLGHILIKKHARPEGLLHLGHSRLAFAPLLFFYGLFLDRIERVEADQCLDVVTRRDAFLGAEAGKIACRPQLLQRTLIEMKADQ